MTPQLTPHARERCAEMGVSTKRVKRIVRDPDLDYCGKDERRVAMRNDEPDIAAVYALTDPPLVITVVWRTQDVYDRATWRPCDERSA